MAVRATTSDEDRVVGLVPLPDERGRLLAGRGPAGGGVAGDRPEGAGGVRLSAAAASRGPARQGQGVAHWVLPSRRAAAMPATASLNARPRAA